MCSSDLAVEVSDGTTGGAGLADLERLTHLLEAELSTRTTPDDAERALRAALATVLVARFEHSGDRRCLDGAVRLYRQAVEPPVDEPEPIADRRFHLARALRLRYEEEGAPADLDQALAAARLALDGIAPDHPSYAAYLNNLVNLVRAAFELHRRQEDIDRKSVV